MNPIRIAGLACLAAALVMLVLDLSLGALKPTWQTISLARLWAMIHAGSLMSLQSVVGEFSSLLWNGILLPFISLPLWLTLALLAVVLVAFGRSSSN
ncbi:hypothetical protein A8950_1760 [Dongia mobilis]|uniref:Uncharacterized protein n=1 Tax=Dongia mobilis TaxID=578943 RepID=A0A4R6WST9_9PROT|nr:hypothetical protein [Dongia mobilis]TDQ81940.1 hypothetical protein A8950_1760 [Dongia mobilis]